MAEIITKDLNIDNWETQLKDQPCIAVTDSRSLYDTINKCRNTSAHIDDKRTAIDLTILKGDLEKIGGQVRWVFNQKDEPELPSQNQECWKMVTYGNWL